MVNLERELKTAIQHHLANDFAVAVSIYQDIDTRAPNNAYAWHMLGDLLIQNGLFDEGIALIQKALEITTTPSRYIPINGPKGSV